MTEFPWAALITAVSAVALASLPFLAALSADARYEKTVRILEATKLVHPGSAAERALSDSLDLMAARKLAKLDNGSGTPLYIFALTASSLWLGSQNGSFTLNATNQWITGLSALAFIAAYAAHYWRYLSRVDKARTQAATVADENQQ